MRDRVGVLETAVDNSVDHGFPQECAKMLRDIVFRTHLEVFRVVFLPPARVEHMVERLKLGSRVMLAKPPPESVTVKCGSLAATAPRW